MLNWRKENVYLRVVNDMLIDYPTPTNLPLLWSVGFGLGMILVIQIVTGLLLSMHYTADINHAFDSVEHIMRDVNLGWMLRYTHANGASFFFILLYLHIGKGIYYGSYLAPRVMTWTIGVIIFFLVMGTAFLGYVLPWGAMSFWGATVITNMLSAIPFVGKNLVEWVWGGYSVDNATLTRFFALHFVLPFIIVALVMAHLMSLHETGSNPPSGIPLNDKRSFHPYYTTKDLYAIVLLCLALALFVFYAPNILGHPDNYIKADPLVTPLHIVPEWYFLFAYSILRSIPHKGLGVVAMVGSILILLVLPFTNPTYIRSNQWKPLSKWLFWSFIVNFFILTWIGGEVAEEPYIFIGRVAAAIHFLFFIFFIPVVGFIENWLVYGYKKTT